MSVVVASPFVCFFVFEQVEGECAVNRQIDVLYVVNVCTDVCRGAARIEEDLFPPMRNTRYSYSMQVKGMPMPMSGSRGATVPEEGKVEYRVRARVRDTDRERV